MSGMLRIALVLVAAVVAAIAANFVLLGMATGPHDSVGRLSPRAAAAAPASRSQEPLLRTAPLHRGEREPQDD